MRLSLRRRTPALVALTLTALTVTTGLAATAQAAPTEPPAHVMTTLKPGALLPGSVRVPAPTATAQSTPSMQPMNRVTCNSKPSDTFAHSSGVRSSGYYVCFNTANEGSGIVYLPHTDQVWNYDPSMTQGVYLYYYNCDDHNRLPASSCPSYRATIPYNSWYAYAKIDVWRYYPIGSF